MTFSINAQICNHIFSEALNDYRSGRERKTQVADDKIKSLLYRKQWIDNLQWDAEDHVRDKTKPLPLRIELKEKIDGLNQDRTDVIERLDTIIYERYKDVELDPLHRLNTESPAWAIDRLSILNIKIYQMSKALDESQDDLRIGVQKKLETLVNQKTDLSTAIDVLLRDIKAGLVKIHTFKQMKMYNDETLNPVLRKIKT